ncbi:hypothetical protein ACIBJD_38095 [Kitasatospora sp. NPDC050467]
MRSRFAPDRQLTARMLVTMFLLRVLRQRLMTLGSSKDSRLPMK